MPPRSPKIEEEAYPDSWQRFERAVDVAVKSGPKHKVAKKKAKASKRASSRAKP